MSLDRRVKQSLGVPADERSAPDIVTMPSEDDAPPYNFSVEMNAEM
jgi:hypothetical protein